MPIGAVSELYQHYTWQRRDRQRLRRTPPPNLLPQGEEEF